MACSIYSLPKGRKRSCEDLLLDAEEIKRRDAQLCADIDVSFDDPDDIPEELRIKRRKYYVEEKRFLAIDEQQRVKNYLMPLLINDRMSCTEHYDLPFMNFSNESTKTGAVVIITPEGYPFSEDLRECTNTQFPLKLLDRIKRKAPYVEKIVVIYARFDAYDPTFMSNLKLVLNDSLTDNNSKNITIFIGDGVRSETFRMYIGDDMHHLKEAE